jgi:hypothetical protein
MTLKSKMERLLLLLGQATSIARIQLNRMKFLRTRTSSTQWFQILAAGHLRRADNMTLKSKMERLLLLLG